VLTYSFPIGSSYRHRTRSTDEALGASGGRRQSPTLEKDDSGATKEQQAKEGAWAEKGEAGSRDEERPEEKRPEETKEEGEVY